MLRDKNKRLKHFRKVTNHKKFPRDKVLGLILNWAKTNKIYCYIIKFHLIFEVSTVNPEVKYTKALWQLPVEIPWISIALHKISEDWVIFVMFVMMYENYLRDFVIFGITNVHHEPTVEIINEAYNEATNCAVFN